MHKSLVVIALGLGATFLLPGSGAADVFGRDRTVRGSGHIVSETRDVSGFDRIDLAGSCDLEISVGKDYKVTVVGDDNLIEFIRTEVSGSGTLHIESERSYSTRRGIRIEISMPHLTDLEITGSGDAELSGLKEDELEINITGSGDVQLAGEVHDLDIDIRGSGDVDVYDLQAETVRVSSSGSGDVELEGHADMLEIVQRGSGDVDARRLEAISADAELYGSGDLAVRAKESFDGSVFGSGDIDLYGNPPRLNRRVMGSGDINHRR